ncbi:MAG: dihydrofolate reductase family protein [Patescibacteria group bacterium]
MKIILCLAQTADGKIAKDSNHLADWTSKEDKRHFIQLTKKHKAIIMGESTFLTIGRPLPNRLNLILTQNPEKYISKQKTDHLEFINMPPYQVTKYLEQKGYESAILGGGAFTNSQFFDSDLVDEIYLTVEGIIFGEGLSLTTKLKNDINLKIIKIKKLSKKTYLIHYQIIK